MTDEPVENDSQRRAGGWIPGAPGVPAFTLHGREPSPIPILIAAPHAGRAYPRALLQDMRQPEAVVLRLEDRYVDRLALAVSRETGAPAVIANAPRAMVDLNRAPEDIDWDMFAKEARPAGGQASATRRARSGLGLIPRRLPGTGELWRRRFGRSDLDGRLEGVHEPYHRAIASALQDLRARWGAALLIDLHSMPPLPGRPGSEAPQIVVGDRFGSSCHGALVASVFTHLAARGRAVAHNRPYAGGYVLDRHGDPRAMHHALQLEIDRSAYLDSALAEPGPGMAAMIEDLAGLVRALAAEVCELGRERGGSGWPQAAE